SASGRELVVVLGEGMRLQTATLGVRGGIEVDDHRPLRERRSERILEYFTIERCRRLEVRGLVTCCQRSCSGKRHHQSEQTDQTCHTKLLLEQVTEEHPPPRGRLGDPAPKTGSGDQILR